MKPELLAIRLVKSILNNDYLDLETLGNEDVRDIRKAWELARTLLNNEEIKAFKQVLTTQID